MLNYRHLKELSMDDLQKRVPAAFALQEKETLSDKYLYIPTFQIVQGLIDNGFKIVGAQSGTSRKNTNEHSKHVISLTHGTIEGLAAKEGTALIRIENSHNGLSTFKINAGFYRLVCSNGLIAPDSSVANSRIRHIQGMKEDVIEASFRVIEQMPLLMESLNHMKSIALNRDEKLLLAESSVNILFDQKTIDLNKTKRNDLRERLLIAHNNVDRTSTDLWSTFNVIQENAIRGGFKMFRESEKGEVNYAKRREVTSIDSNKKINQELMALAQKFAELKSA